MKSKTPKTASCDIPCTNLINISEYRVNSEPPIQLIGCHRREVEYGREKSHTSHKVSGSGASLRVTQLRPGTQHQFWVTAATEKGEGRSSQVVSKTPSSRHLTQVTDIGREIYTSWRSQVRAYLVLTHELLQNRLI